MKGLKNLKKRRKVMIYSLDSIKQIINEKNRKNFEALGGLSMYGYKICKEEEVQNDARRIRASH